MTTTTATNAATNPTTTTVIIVQLRHNEFGTMKTCRFVHGGVDLNGVLFRTETLRALNASFSALHTPCTTEHMSECQVFSSVSVAQVFGFADEHPYGSVEDLGRACRCRVVDNTPYWCADWGLVWQVIQGGGQPRCLESNRPMFLQN